MRRRSGFTFAEILVVCFLLMVVMGMMMQLLLPSVWLFRMESARSDAQQSALIVANRLQQAILNSQMESISVFKDPTALCFQEIIDDHQPFDVSTGAPLMSPYFRIYWYEAESKRLLMRVWPPGPPDTLSDPINFGASSQPQRLTSQADLIEIVNADKGREVVARNVEVLTITDYNNDADNDLNVLTPPLEVSVTCSLDTSMQGAMTNETYSLKVKAVPRSTRW